MNKKIFILLGHPSKNSINYFFAQSYLEGAREKGFEVRFEHIGSLDFDPVLWEGYDKIQELEPDLKRIQENIKWADHLVFFYPIWWGTMPAILKGMFDRIFLPGFAYQFNESGTWWKKFLKGKSARIVVTLDNFALLQKVIFGDFTDEIKKNVLKFSGVSPVKITAISRVSKLSREKKERWAEKLRKLGRRGA